MSQRGFTLIEVLVALGIAATALVVMVGRLGASSDLQLTLQHQMLLQDIAMNRLAEQQLAGQFDGQEHHGDIEQGGIRFDWKTWSEKTELDGFVRNNVEVSMPGEPPFTLFAYRWQP